jgi:tetratricopeptide (TPR) repeat protein
MPDSPLNDKEVALTGSLFALTRSEAVDRIRQAGGRHTQEPGEQTSILIAGNATGHLKNDGGIPRNILLFDRLKQRGTPIRLVEEPDFLRMVGSQADLADFSRLYTAEQVSHIADTPLPVVRSWVRKGLLQPARLEHRLAWFQFTDILTARNLNRLTTAGVPASRIHRSLTQIAKWLPDGNQILGRLESYATGLRLRLPDGTWVEPTGQRLMDFPVGSAAAATTGRVSVFPSVPAFSADGGQDSWFRRAVDAEESGDLQAAIGMYSRALESSEEPELFFNLGNVLYELGREESAAERYLQAIEVDNAYAEAWNNLGNSLVAIGRLADGVHAYEMALSLEPEYPEPHCNLATVLDRVGQPGQAISHRGACRDAFPSEVRLTLLRRATKGDTEED